MPGPGTPRRVTQAEAIGEVQALASTRDGQTMFIGVDGPGGAGKSTFAARLAAGLDDVALIAVDDFAGPRLREWDWVRFDEQVTQPLLAGRPARYQRWDWELDSGAEWHQVPPGVLVIVEGVSATRRERVVPWTLTIWVETPSEVRRTRAIERDGAAMFAQWSDVWIPSEQAYIATQNPLGWIDLIISGTE